MKSCPEQKRNEIFEVSISDACSYPWTMVIMHFNADTTLATMKGSWGSQMIACITITKLIVSFLLIYFYCSLSSYIAIFNRQIFEFFEAVKFINRINKFDWIHRIINFLFLLVFNIVFFIPISPIFFWINNWGIHFNTWKNTWICEWYIVKTP